MSKSTLLAIAAAITAIANDLDDTPSAPAGDPAEPKAKGRGRPPKTETTAVVGETTGTTTIIETPAAEKPAEIPAAKLVGKTPEEYLAALKAIIKAPVEAGEGEAVKALIVKHLETEGTLKDLAGLPEKHAAFEKDVKAMVY